MRQTNSHLRHHAPHLLAGAILTALGSIAGAGETLPVINVTATRIAQTADETLASVTVVTREQIETSQAKSMVELLDGMAGISLRSNGGYGKTTSLSLRGTNAEQVLVLIDGVRVGSATLGSTAWQFLPLAQIDRIEIVRGPRSHLYGSEAVGGVIQIFTRQGEDGFHPNFRAGFGTDNTFDGGFGFRGGQGDTSYSLQLDYLDSDGFNARVGNDPDDDGYTNASLSASLDHRFSDELSVRLSAFQAEGTNEYDGWIPTSRYDEDFVQRTIHAAIDWSPADWWSMSLSAGQSWDESTHYTDDVRTSAFKTRRPQASWQNDFYLGEESVLTAGIDYLQDRVDGSVQYVEESRDNTGLFVQYQTRFGAHSLSGGLRHDDNQAYGGNTTGDIAWGWAVRPDLRLVASYGTAFRAPTFNDLYYPISGNPDLDPETSWSGELGLEGTPAWGRWSLRAYRTRIDDLIQWAPTADPWIWRPQNIASAEIDGLELSAATEVEGWTLSASLTFLDAWDAEQERLLPGRSKRSLRLDADRRFGRFGVGATVRGRSEIAYYDFLGNATPLDGFMVIDLRGSYDLTPEWRLQGRVGNLFDEQYQTVPGYNQAGLELFVGVVYQPR